MGYYMSEYCQNSNHLIKLYIQCTIQNSQTSKQFCCLLYIKQVAEDVIHEALKGSGCVCKSKGHDAPFKGAVAGAESCFPFVTLVDMDQMVCMMEVDFQIESCLTQAV